MSKIFILVSEILLLGKKYIRNIIIIDIGILIRNAVSQSKYSTIRLPHSGPITPPNSAEAPINPNPYIQYFFYKIKDTPTMQIGIMAPPPIACKNLNIIIHINFEGK